MEESLRLATKYSVFVIDWIALVVIVVGTLAAALGAARVLLSTSSEHQTMRGVWLHYARWLIAGLTFQLAADIIETAVAPSWDEIGKLGAIAAIRTFLNYFLERDVNEIREREEVR